MKALGAISNPKDLANKQYVDSRSGVTSVNGQTGNVILKAADVEAAPIWESGVTYAADAWVVYNGYLWRNTSGAASTNVEPGTNYNVWNVNYSNRNLLDNPWFTVNQRGITSLTGKGYFVDRWYSSNSNAMHTVADGIITLGNNGSGNSFCRQFIYEPLIPDKIYTLSFLIKGVAKGYISLNRSNTDIIGTNMVYNDTFADWTIVSHTLTIPQDELDASISSIRCDNGYSYQIKAAKLELGSVSTLANDTIPDYGTEFVKCVTSTADSADTYANKTLLTE